MQNGTFAVHFWAAAALLAASSGCTSHQAIENARARGVEAGNREGRRAGEAEGFGAIAAEAREEAYQSTLTHLNSVGESHLRPIYTVLVVFGAFTFGFVAQWVGFYLSRRAGVLTDIDWMILPPSLTKLNLADETGVRSLGPPTACILLLFTFSTVPGCKNAEQEAWHNGYKEAYRLAFDEGWRSVADKAKQEGASIGQIAAQTAATSGSDWRLYYPFALLFCGMGIFVGIFVQYMVMLNCRQSSGFPEFLTIVFVPAMKHSLAYRVFEKKRQLMLAASEEIRNLALAKNLRLAQMQSVQQTIVKKLKTISSLEEYSKASLMALAKNEMDRIVAASDQAVAKDYLTVKCPHCEKPVGYTVLKAGTSVKCPHKQCRRSIFLPKTGEKP